MFWILAFWNIFFSLSISVTFLHAYFWLIVYVSPRYENCLMHMHVRMIGSINLWLHDLSHLFEVLLPVMFIALMLLISLYSVNFVYVVDLFSKWSWNFQICAGRYISNYTQYKSKRPVTVWQQKHTGRRCLTIKTISKSSKKGWLWEIIFVMFLKCLIF